MIELFATIAAVSAVSCVPPPGASTLWSAPSTRWLIVGEDHGTEQEPIAFQNIVCAASANRKVAVAVEQPSSEQSAIDKFIRSSGNAAARATFMKSLIWQNQFKDGRSSQAQFQLFVALRELYAHNKISGVFAFIPDANISNPADYERAMADRLKGLSANGNLIIALVGNVHAMRTKVSFAQPPYMPMAGWLPREQTIAAAFKTNGGTQWACNSMTDCGNISLGPPQNAVSAKTVSHRDAALPYSATIYLGKVATGSPPQVPLTPPAH